MDENKTYGTRLARLWKLFLSTLYISSFTFGGGFVIVTFICHRDLYEEKICR